MIIKEIRIENFLCYFDVKPLPLADGLNIILGENGEGKTKLFEALYWLLNGDGNNLEQYVSAKALAEAEKNEPFRVMVSIEVEQYGETKHLTRSFYVKKTGDEQCEVFNATLEGIEEKKSGERSQVDGKNLLDQIFPSQIRRYSMFKGEAALNIFDNEDALINLINLFSDAKHYDKYSEKGQFLKKNAEKAVEDATKSHSANKTRYKALEGEIEHLTKKKCDLEVMLDNANDQLRKTQENLEEVENHVKNAEALEVVNKRIKECQTKMSDTASRIDENYTTALFDESWLLMYFEPFHETFHEKVTELSKQKRKLQTEFDREIGKKIGERKAKADLLNNAIPLPVGVPSKAHMAEMIKDQICKVCNREAKKGSDPYNFMVKRMEEYLETQKPEKDEDDEKEILFKKDYTNRLVNMSGMHEDNLANLRGIGGKIKEHFEFNEDRKNELAELEETYNAEVLEREKIVGNSTSGEDKLSQVLHNYTAWQKDVLRYGKEILDYEGKIKELEVEIKSKVDEKEGIDTKSANAFLLKTREILRDVETIFKETKESKFDEFISLLEAKSNEYFELINKGAFTGLIKFEKLRRGNKTVVEIQLQEDGRPLYKPNQSLETSMHISVLFGISQLAKEKREEAYPLIFDAPTSSFGETKTGEFLNIISETDNQIVLLSKDFISKDKKTGELKIKDEFKQVKRDKAIWIRLARPFDPKNLKTINTEVINL